MEAQGLSRDGKGTGDTQGCNLMPRVHLRIQNVLSSCGISFSVQENVNEQNKATGR